MMKPKSSGIRLKGALAVVAAVLCAGVALAVNEVDVFGVDETPDPVIPSATVKTDSEMESLLQRANQFAQQGRYDLATILWQQVIDRSGDVVFTRDEWVRRTLEHRYQTYRGITSDIEQTLSTLPKEGLEGYRLKADSEARAILMRAGAEGREAALAEVVRRFFLSSQGDDAAFELACLKLDRFEFLPAARLLLKLRNDYPDSEIPEDEITVRLLAANARVGDIAGAKILLKELRESEMDSRVVDLVAADLKRQESLTSVAVEDATKREWRMPHGNAKRSGISPDLPDAIVQARNLGVAWEQSFDLRLPEDWPELPVPEIDPYSASRLRPSFRLFNRGNIRSAQNNDLPEEPKTLVNQWLENDWMPTGQFVTDGALGFFKTHYYTVAVDLKKGGVNWIGFRNTFPQDSLSEMAQRYSAYNRREDVPDMEAVELFADQVHQGMTMSGDLLLTFQGPPVDFIEEQESDEFRGGARQQRLMNMGVANGTGRTRDNRLVAYGTKTGKVRWMRHEGDGQFGDGTGVSFAGSAAPYGSMLLVPVHHGSSLWVYALDAASGETLWRTFLANEPSGFCTADSPVSIAVDGGDAYVGSGAGLVFSIDAISGALNWAFSYQRSADVEEETDNRMFRGVQRNPSEILNGWAEDVVIPYGQSLIFAASDYDALAAIDRRTGGLLWDTPRVPVTGGLESRYVLGVHDGRVVVAGNKVVRCYKANGGRMLWNREIEKSHARGLLTDGGVFIPQAGHIAQLNPETGELIRRIPVQPGGDEDEPVGNLFSSGSGLLAFGSKRVYALEPADKAEVKEEPESKPEVETVPETNKEESREAG